MATTVETTNAKAVIGSVIGFVGAVATGVEQIIPDPTLKIVVSIITIVVAAAGTYFGIYNTTNKPKD